MKKYIILAIALCSISSSASAQDSFKEIIKEATKKAAIDPTTYIPGTVSFVSQKLDWDSSQLFFERGFVEKNPVFTLSGKPYDIPVGYGQGMKRITIMSLKQVGLSYLNNAGAEIMGKFILKQNPEKKKLVRALIKAEKIAMAVAVSYYISEGHFKQWQLNNSMARQMTLR